MRVIMARGWSAVNVAHSVNNSVPVMSGTQVIATVAAGLSPFGIDVEPAKSYLYLSDEGSNDVTVGSTQQARSHRGIADGFFNYCILRIAWLTLHDNHAPLMIELEGVVFEDIQTAQ